MSDPSSEHNQSFLAEPMARMTALVIRYPFTALAIGVAIGVAALGLSAAKLGYHTSRLDLLNPNSDYNQLWIEYIKEFGEDDDAVVVVEGASRDVVVPVLQEVSAALAREGDLFHAILHEVDLSHVQSKGLHYVGEPDLLGIEQFLMLSGPIVSGGWAQLSVGNQVAGLCAQIEQQAAAPPGAVPSSLPDAERLCDSLWTALSDQGNYRSPWPGMPASFATLSELSSEYLLTNEGKLGFVLLRLARGKSGFAQGTEATDRLRAVIAQIGERHPETHVGLTGLPIMENDEMRASQNSMFWASVVSFVGVGLLFVAGFGGLRHAILANAILLLGMAWAFGYVTISIGHLNILSVSFTVTLIGIGIDYGVHYVCAYLQLRETIRDPGEALIQSSRAVGPAIVTGAVTTAVSFFCAGVTSFTGVAELGIIAGGGLLLCAVAELTLLPAAVYLTDRSSWGKGVPTPLPIHTWVAPLTRFPLTSLAVTAVFTVFVGLGVTKLWYDHNLLNMQPVGLESVEIERKLLAECNQSMWYALSIADSREELLARKAEFLKLESVERTEEIVSMLPTDTEVKQPIIARIHDQLEELPERPPLLPVDRPDHLGRLLGRLEGLVMSLKDGGRCARQLQQIRDLLRRLPTEDCYAMTTAFQQRMAGDLLSRLHMLRVMSNPEPPKLDDLPESLVHRFVGHNGKHLLKIFGRGNIWDMQALKHFVHDVRTVDAKATGNPLQAYEASLEMKRSYEQAAFYALGVNLLVLFFDFRSVRFTLLALAPLGIGLLQMLGLLGLLNIPLNPANMIALPLILGIGVDYGVHILHEYRDQTGPYRMSKATAVAVMVDSLTTIVGFGALMIASHQGLQSLGRVLTIGVSCCMFTSMVMLPPLLAWMSRNRKPAESGDVTLETSDEKPRDRGLLRRRDPASPPQPTGHWQPDYQSINVDPPRPDRISNR